MSHPLCPYCQSAIASHEARTVCSACRIAHHTDCWVENGGCTTYGCSLGPGARRAPARPQPAPPSPSPRPEVAISLEPEHAYPTISRWEPVTVRRLVWAASIIVGLAIAAHASWLGYRQVAGSSPRRPAVSQASRPFLTVTTLNVRSAPRTGRVIVALPPGTRVGVLTYRDGWCEVVLRDGRWGWCSRRYLRKE